MRKGVAIAALAGLAVYGGVRAWNWPNQHADAMVEAVAIGDIRTVTGSENMYSLSNNGAFDTPACLAAPARCIPRYAEPPASFLDPWVAELGTRRGYARRFFPGPREAKGLSPSSMKTYAYVAFPVEPGKLGVRGFCGNSDGVICFTADGRMPPVVNGHCVTTEEDPKSACATLR